jgi:Immunity protein 35/Papain fold toxin 1, glutamine deamidase
MLNATLVVPKDGTVPFHPGNADPWADIIALERNPGPREPKSWVDRVNARGCVVTANAALDGAQASVTPWRPMHEAPGWWGRMVARYLPGSRVTSYPGWEPLLAAVAGAGPQARGVVWIRRELGGEEATGHLLLLVAHPTHGVLALDPQTGGLGRLDTTEVRKLTLALFTSPRGEAAPGPAWERPADDLPAAVRKAEAWLAGYEGAVRLVDPAAEDDLGRGWLFACNTGALLDGGDWRTGMLDAALVVPKDDTAPFGLPNSEPWAWLRRWCEGGQPGQDGLEPLPQPGPAAWFTPTLARLGPVLETRDYRTWLELLADFAQAPEGVRVLVWERRRDGRGRETVGRLVVAAQTATGIALLDATQEGPAQVSDHGVLALHAIRYR